MRRFVIISAILSLLLISTGAAARRPDTLHFENSYLDTVRVNRTFLINDYTTIGVNAGVTFSRMLFNPVKDHDFLFSPKYASIYYTRYGKMFGYLPYFGVMLGVEYGHEGFEFKEDSSGSIRHDNGITRCDMTLISVPAMAQIHVDVDPFKMMAGVGVYGGYRLDINRSWPSSQDAYIDAAYKTSFKSYEYRWDYGLQGGLGVAFMFDPVEIHFGAMVRWSWSDLYAPDYLDERYHPSPNNTYYYRFATPLDIMVYAGVHFQLTKRKGKTNAQLKREAREKVYGKPEDIESQDR